MRQILKIYSSLFVSEPKGPEITQVTKHKTERTKMKAMRVAGKSKEAIVKINASVTIPQLNVDSFLKMCKGGTCH